ncbi:MAG: polysaccharide deacetylase family protein [Candidatus Eremiobacteraeota bacterium]|nr:polysaccharide deacetylase family protein [Candidatus Eremiobacteraeota bacterium]MBC5827265.1 polysaccharide deacetylase family protein [Candidatus Eremiobacteraeota bacterium]
MRQTVGSARARGRWSVIAIVVLALAALLAASWYFFENPSNQTFGHTVTLVPVHQKVVALTYDDGPNPPYTNEIVNYLHAVKAPATFFVVGKAVAKYPDAVRLEARDGNAIGNHTWDHAHLVLESRRHIQRELNDTAAEIALVTGVQTHIFRPPFGGRDFTVIRVAHQLGYQVIMWSVPLPRDWAGPRPRVIAARVLRYVRDGSIIALHDGNRGQAGNRANTVAATKLIVEALRARGYTFVTVPDLIRLGYSAQKVTPPGPTEYENAR